MALAAGHTNDLLFLCDNITKRRFLVDTGAEVSVIPATGLETRTRQPGPPLLAANGSAMEHVLFVSISPSKITSGISFSRMWHAPC